MRSSSICNLVSFRALLLTSLLAATSFGGCNCNPIGVGGNDGIDGGVGSSALDADAGAVVETCDFERSGTADDDYFVPYELTITKVPASIEMHLANTFEEPQLSIEWRGITPVSVVGCAPDNCDGSNQATTIPTLDLSAELHDLGTYLIRVENFSYGSDFTLTGTITGNADACGTIQ